MTCKPKRVTMPPDQIKWMRAAIAARRIGVSRQRVSALIAECRFDAIVYFREVYVLRSQVVAYVAATGDASQYLSIQEVADDFGVHRVTVSGWLKQDLLPSTMVGRRRMIPRAAVEGFVPPHQRPRPTKRVRKLDHHD